MDGHILLKKCIIQYGSLFSKQFFNIVYLVRLWAKEYMFIAY